MKAGRERRTLRIRRLRCPKCGRMHRELPDCLVPFKHYETQVISGVLDGVVTPDDEISEDYPSEGTMKRWSHWLKANSLRMEGYLRAFGSLLSDFKELLNSGAALLPILRSSTPQWLEWITLLIYNSGGLLVPVY